MKNYIFTIWLATTVFAKTPLNDYDDDGQLDYNNYNSNQDSVYSESNEVDTTTREVTTAKIIKPIVKPKREEIVTTEATDIKFTHTDPTMDPIKEEKENSRELDKTTVQPAYSSPKYCKNKSTKPSEPSEENESSSTLINYPFSVSIQRKGAHYASGALIDKRWILSSAGVFYNVREAIKLFRARLGSVDCKRGGTLVPLKRVEIHPMYVHKQPTSDLAMLKLAQPIEYTDFIRPIAFTNIKTKVMSAKFMTTYWPRLIINGHVLPPSAKERIKQNSMRVSTQHLIPMDRCQKMLNNNTLDETTLCLKPVVTHHSQCSPDAGSPVVADDGLWGITSGWTSKDCQQHASPTIFCRISVPSIRSWIDSQLLSS